MEGNLVDTKHYEILWVYAGGGGGGGGEGYSYEMFTGVNRIVRFTREV